MDFSSIVAAYIPYWLLGAGMLYATYKSEHKDLVRVEPKTVAKWTGFLVLLTIYRTIMFKYFPDAFAVAVAKESVSTIPWQLTLTVFWEDACHGLPLVLLRRFLGTKWYAWPVHIITLAMVMFAFGLGHTYQGIGAATLLSLYIPASMDIGKRRGFGTVMINHTLYDLSTVLFMKWITG